jgi:hypothetical protein
VTCGRVLGAIVALLATAGCGGPTTETGAGGSCVGPQAALAPGAAAAGQQVTYTVEWLSVGCRDTDPSDEVVTPLRDVRVEVVQGTGSAVVGTVSGTGPRYAGSLAFVLPGWLRPGTAEVVLRTPLPDHLPFTVVPGS